MSATRPLDDFRALVERMPAPDLAAQRSVEDLFGREGAGGSRLAGVAATVARTTGSRPSVSRPSLALFAGAHGIARHGISERRLDATLATVAACGSGDAPVSHLCAANMIGLKVYDLALHLPTGDISTTDAMDERNAAATMAFGMEAIAGGADCVLLSAVRSTGDETVAAALLCALLGGTPADWLAQGGHLAARTALVEAALTRASSGDPLEQLSSLGGREFAAMAGAILAARTEKIPVILDGLSALAAATVVAALDANAISHCLLADAPEGAARRGAASLGLSPLLSENMSAGEGTAAALAMSVVRDALALHAGFAAHARGGQMH